MLYSCMAVRADVNDMNMKMIFQGFEAISPEKKDECSRNLEALTETWLIMYKHP